MPVKLTPAQAKALGITAAAVAVPASARPRVRRGGDARVGPVPYHTICAGCGEHFSTRAAETRHLDATRHACYQLVLAFDDDHLPGR